MLLTTTARLTMVGGLDNEDVTQMLIDGKTTAEWEALFAAEDAARAARFAEAQKWGRNVAQDAIDMGEREDFSGYMENLSDAMREHMEGFDGTDYERARDAFKAALAAAGIDPALVH